MPTGGPASPGQVGVLVVEEEPLVEEADLPQVPGPQHGLTTTPGKDLGRLVVLADIGLEEAAVAPVATFDQHRADVVHHVVGLAAEGDLDPRRLGPGRHLDPFAAGGQRDGLDAFGGKSEAGGTGHEVARRDGHPHHRACRRPPEQSFRRPAVLEAVEPIDQLRSVELVRAVHLDTTDPDPERPHVAPCPRNERRALDRHVDEARREQHAARGGTRPGIALERVDQRSEPARVHEGVGVDQRHVIGTAGVVHGQVVGGKAPVAARIDDGHVGEVLADGVGAPVARSVVDHDQVEAVARPVEGLEAAETTEHVVTAVEVQDDGPNERRTVGG